MAHMLDLSQYALPWNGPSSIEFTIQGNSCHTDPPHVKLGRRMFANFFKSTAALVILAFSLVVLVDSFICAEAAAGDQETPAECCVQCCPRHHPVPPVADLEKAFSESLIGKFSVLEMDPPLFLLVKSIFHPPKFPLV